MVFFFLWSFETLKLMVYSPIFAIIDPRLRYDKKIKIVLSGKFHQWNTINLQTIWNTFIDIETR